MTESPAAELHWRVHGLKIAARAWGDPGARPMLALHGWLDNADSFSALAPRLRDHHVVALDLPGHGRSDHRSADGTYQIWDDLPEIIGVLDELGWASIDLLGHSRGANIACLLAAACPERVARLVLLDGIAPEPVSDADFSRQLRRFLEDKRRLLDRDPRILGSLDEAVELRTRRSGLGREAARVICRRNLEAVGEGFQWSTDPRLSGASAVRLNSSQQEAMWRSLTMPALLLLSEQARPEHRRCADRAGCAMPALTRETFPGGHHFLLDGDVERLAGRISKFLQESAA